MALGLTACKEAVPASTDAGPVPVAFRIDLDGATTPILAEDGTGTLELTRAGAEEPVPLAFENGRLAVHALAPGRYAVTHLGSLQCRGLEFDVGARPRYLGALRARVVRAEYYVALMQPAVASAADVARLAGQAGADAGAAGAIDARPLAVTEAAPCFLGNDGPVTTWEDLTLAEKVMLSIGMAGLCAVALVSGGFCHF